MLCPECNEREATIHLTQIINNEKLSSSMCQECAARHGFHSPLDNVPFPLAEILAGMTKHMPRKQSDTQTEQLVCPGCNMSFDQFANQGRFGCGECYTAFRPRLEVIMRKIHGASLHRGRNPGMEDSGGTFALVPVKEEERLDSALKRAIEEEDFERAAELRDKLRLLRDSLPKEEGKEGKEKKEEDQQVEAD